MQLTNLFKAKKAILLLSALSFLSSSLYASNDITGSYFGTYQLSMNVLFPGDDGMPDRGVQLGATVQNGYWQWDFDNNLIIWGGSRHSTMLGPYPSFQPYTSAMLNNQQKTDEIYAQIEDVSEISIPFIDNGDGTYSVDYAHKIHLVLGDPTNPIADKPIGAANITFQATKSEMGELVIKTLDREINGPDGIPGTIILGVFPMPVQPQFDSVKMLFDDQQDSNNDGITDAIATTLMLDINSTNSDADNFSDLEELGIFVRPTDSDNDGLADVYEPGDSALQANIVSQLPLLSGEKVELKINTGEHLSFTHAQPIPEKITFAEGTAAPASTLNKSMGFISFNMTNFQGDSSTTLRFAQPIPKDLQLFQFSYTETEGEPAVVTIIAMAIEATELQWTQVNESEVSFNLDIRQPNPTRVPAEGEFDTTNNSGTITGLMLVHSEKNRLSKPVAEVPVAEIPVVEVPVTPEVIMVNSPVVDTSTGSKSGGSMNWLFIICLGFVALGRKKLTKGKVSL